LGEKELLRVENPSDETWFKELNFARLRVSVAISKLSRWS
jgi:hypothetical protein